MEVRESGIAIIENTANFLSNLGVIVVALLVIWFILCLIDSFCRANEKWEKEKREHIRQTSHENYPWQCLLIDGVWGSGKTTHYEKHYQYIDNQPNIYISCFSASRSELIAQIIQQQFWCQLLTINGLLAKLMESNWRIFMPKKRVIVFDDLERLHANQDNYLDLIGIIDYLKDKNGCKIILICNMLELKEPIFNTYMERIVDEVLDWEQCTIDKLLPDNNTILTKLVVNYVKYHKGSRTFSNKRIVKNILQNLDDWIKKDESLNSKDIYDSSIIAGCISYDIYCIIKWRYIFFYDHNFFINLIHEVHDKFMGYERGKKIIAPSSGVTDEHLKSNDYRFDFDTHYLSNENQKVCETFQIDKYELLFLAKSYGVVTSKTSTQLHTEYYDNLTGRYIYRDKNAVTFNINKILESKFRDYDLNQFKIDVIFELHIGLKVILLQLNNDNFYHSVRDDDYENVINPTLDPNQFAESISKHPDVFDSIQKYKGYLRIKSKDLKYADYINKIKTSSNLDNILIKLGIVYFVEQAMYKQIVCRIELTKNELDTLKNQLNNFAPPPLFFDSIDIRLWCFEDINKTNILFRMSDVYKEILADLSMNS